MEEVAFFVGAIGALGGAIAVIALRNPFYSVLALIVHLFALAGLFLLLHAEFIAAAQVVVYAGAVMVLYVFVAAYVGNVDEPLWEPIPGQRILAPLLGLALFVELSIAILGTALKTFDSEGPIIASSFGSPEAIGELLLEEFLIAFEAASLLLLLAAVGAVVLAGKRDTDPDDDPPPPPPEPSPPSLTSTNVGTRVTNLAAHEGGPGEGPAGTQRAGNPTILATPAAPGRRAPDGPSPGTPPSAAAGPSRPGRQGDAP